MEWTIREYPKESNFFSLLNFLKIEETPVNLVITHEQLGKILASNNIRKYNININPGTHIVKIVLPPPEPNPPPPPNPEPEPDTLSTT